MKKIALGFIFAFVGVATDAPAASVDLDFHFLPSAQPSGTDFTYETLNSRTETQTFHVGLNAFNQPTLFQNSIGVVATGGADGNQYKLDGFVDPLEPEFDLKVRAAVTQQEAFSNRFGFSFLVAYDGSFVNIGIGQDVIQVVDSQSLHSLSVGAGSDYHNYELSGTVGQTWTLSMDSTVIGTGAFALTTVNELTLGDDSAGGNAMAEVTQYTFTQSGAHAAAPLPAPVWAAVSLVCLVVGFRRLRSCIFSAER